VSELNRQARRLLEQGIATLWMEGEVSNLARPASGHVYFTLKDQQAQLRCAWFRQRQRGPTLHLQNGDKMLALGKLSIYEARGEYQMIVERMEAAGEGELRRRFEMLRNQLQSEGLFDAGRKHALPELPGCIGIITSPSGAAVHDILTGLQRRFPLVPVIVYPSAVQGVAAAGELVSTLTQAIARAECDVLIVARGGGSLEDLWAFNDETLARAISACPIPVISAVGHEVDFTIADFVADLRAPTPSGAAERVVPDQGEWWRTIIAAGERLTAFGRRHIDNRTQTLDGLAGRLARSNPGASVARQTASLSILSKTLAATLHHDLTRRYGYLHSIRSRLLQRSPVLQLQYDAGQLKDLRYRLETATRNRLDRSRSQLSLAARGMSAVSPLATLERGYAIVSEAETGQAITDAGQLQQGARIAARLASGSLEATVTEVHAEGD